jgi:hypothetical protein
VVESDKAEDARKKIARAAGKLLRTKAAKQLSESTEIQSGAAGMDTDLKM